MNIKKSFSKNELYAIAIVALVIFAFFIADYMMFLYDLSTTDGGTVQDLGGTCQSIVNGDYKNCKLNGDVLIYGGDKFWVAVRVTGEDFQKYVTNNGTCTVEGQAGVLDIGGNLLICWLFTTQPYHNPSATFIVNKEPPPPPPTECSITSDCQIKYQSCNMGCINGNCQPMQINPTTPCKNAVWKDYPACDWDATKCICLGGETKLGECPTGYIGNITYSCTNNEWKPISNTCILDQTFIILFIVIVVIILIVALSMLIWKLRK